MRRVAYFLLIGLSLVSMTACLTGWMATSNMPAAEKNFYMGLSEADKQQYLKSAQQSRDDLRAKSDPEMVKLEKEYESANRNYAQALDALYELGDESAKPRQYKIAGNIKSLHPPKKGNEERFKFYLEKRNKYAKISQELYTKRIKLHNEKLNQYAEERKKKVQGVQRDDKGNGNGGGY